MRNTIYVLLILCLSFVMFNQEIIAQDQNIDSSENSWKTPDEDILKILHAPQLPRTSISPQRTHMLLSDPVVYPQSHHWKHWSPLH